MYGLEILYTDGKNYVFLPPWKLRARTGIPPTPTRSNSLLVVPKGTFIVVLFVNCYIVFHFYFVLFQQLCKFKIYSVTCG